MKLTTTLVKERTYLYDYSPASGPIMPVLIADLGTLVNVLVETFPSKVSGRKDDLIRYTAFVVGADGEVYSRTKLRWEDAVWDADRVDGKEGHAAVSRAAEVLCSDE